MDHRIIMEKQSLLQKSPVYKLANSSLCCKYIDDIIDLAKQNRFRAIEWDLNYIPPTLNKNRQQIMGEKIKRASIEVRYHLPYSYIEIAHEDNEIRKMSILTLRQYINFIARLNGHFAILHIGYNEGSNARIALDSLISLADYAECLGVRLCIENLIKGLTTDADFLCDVFAVSNVALCLDTGHADVVINKNKNFYDVLYANVDKVYHVHCYKTEDDYYNHIPFSDIDELKQSQIFSLVSQSQCHWLTMELERQEDQNDQMQILQAYLNT